MDKLSLTFEPFIDEDTRQFIVNGVDNHNIAATGRPDYWPVNFVLRSEHGDVAGGLLGLIWADWLQVTYLWVALPYRGRGQAAELLTAAESYARTRGCIGATLETHNPQARALYERQGYELFGEIPDYPPGGAKTFLRKRLA